MKNIIILLMLITTSLQAVTFNKVIMAKSNIKKVCYIRTAQYKNEIGFQYDYVYFMTDKKTFSSTINNEMCMYRWNVYTNTNGEYLRNHKQIYVVCSYKDNYITLMFYMDSDNPLNTITITFDKGEL